MPKTTILYIILAAVVAITTAVFQYFYKNKNKDKEVYILALLRSLTLFLLLLLFINPKIKRKTTTIVKPNLVVAIDNSASIKNFKAANKVTTLVQKIQQDQQLNQKFDIDYFSFGNDIEMLDSLTFSDKYSNIYKPLQQFKTLYKNKTAPILLITDGNQTVGSDYEFFKGKQAIYPVIVGDTIQKLDCKITQLNANAYTFLKNTFPVEVFVSCNTKKPITTRLSIYQGKQKLFSKQVNFDAQNNSKVVTFKMPANRVGKHFYKAYLGVLKNESNTLNNTQHFAVEVIDERAKILVLTSFLHPDIGMLKRSIESNPQREVVIQKIADFKEGQFSNYQLVILYQPNANFDNTFRLLKQTKQHYFIITGSKTDWNFLNNAQTYFKRKALTKTENYGATFNQDFDTYIVDPLDFSKFPPLVDTFGDISFSIANQTMLQQNIAGFDTKNPLLTTFEDNTFKGAVLFGENSWKWRSFTIKDKNSPLSFDIFIGKLVQYLSDTSNKNHLNTTSKPFYFANENIILTTDFVDKNFTFNPNASIWLTLTNKATKFRTKLPFYIDNNSYKVSLSDLKPGNYSYTVQVDNHSDKNFGSFKVIDFEQEKLFTNANVTKLENLAAANTGFVFYANSSEAIFEKFKEEDARFKSIQQQKISKTALIDWKWLLGLLTLLLSIEWFVRKYFGKI